MTTTGTFSRARFELLRAVATREPNISVTAPPLIDRLVAEGLIKYAALTPVLTPDGATLYRRWAREQALAERPGVTVHHARKPRRCVAANPNRGWRIEVLHPDRTRTGFDVEGSGGVDYIDRLRADNPSATVTATPIPNPDYDPDCVGNIRAGDPYVEHHNNAGPGRTGRRLCIRCAMRLTPEEADHARTR